jgi:hypothetical protein
LVPSAKSDLRNLKLICNFVTGLRHCLELLRRSPAYAADGIAIW